jgi:tetratricopeptide (TPR) repeat protein
MRKLLILTTTLILFGFVLTANSSVIAQQKDKKGQNYSDKVERRIDKLTMVLADKAEEGIETKEAEKLLLKALDLFKGGKLEKAMETMDQVEKSLGLEPMRFDREPREGGFGRGQMGEGRQRMFVKREFSDEEIKMIKGEILDMMKEAQKLIEKGNFEDAFIIMGEVQGRIGEITGQRPPMMGPGGGQGGPWNQNQGQMNPWGMGPGGGMGGPQGQGPGGGMSPQGRPRGEQGPFFGQGREGRDPQGMGFSGPRGEKFKDPQFRKEQLDKIFDQARGKGKDGYEKLSTMFGKIINRLDEKKVDYNKDAVATYEKSKKLAEQNKLDDAFGTLQRAFEIINESVDQSVFDPGGWGIGDRDRIRDKDRVRDKDRTGNKDQVRKQDRDRIHQPALDKEAMVKMQNAMKPLMAAAEKYVAKHGKDDFINKCYEEWRSLKQKVNRGEIKVDDVVKKAEELRKKIEKET